MRYTLEADSKTTGQRIYWDGYGWTLAKTNARVFYQTQETHASANIWTPTQHARNISALFNGHDVQIVEHD